MADASNAVAETRQKFHAKQKDLAEVMELAKTSDPNRFDLGRKSVLEKLGATSRDHAVETVKAWNRELEELGETLVQDQLKQVQETSERYQKQLETPVGGHQAPEVGAPELKSLGNLFIQTKQYREGFKTYGHVNPTEIDISMKALFQRSAGFAPEATRSGLVVPGVVHSLAEILDIIPSFPTTQTHFKYMVETTRTHGAAEKAEGVQYPESEFVFTEVSSPVEKIPDSIPVTDEQLEDEGTMASLLDQRLTFGVRRRLASQCVNGDGTAPNLRGVLNVQGIQDQPKGSDSIMAAAYKAITKVRVTGAAEPGVFVFHPNNWQTVVLSQESTGGFLWGHPAMQPATSLWGLRVALSTGIAAGTAVVGDFANFSRLDEKRGVIVEAGYIDKQFVEGKKTLRASLRAAFTVTRPPAFCTISDLGS